MFKICRDCQNELPLVKYNKNKNKKDGLHIICKKCSSIRNKVRYNSQKNKIKQQCNKYYHLNKDVIKPKLKEYRNKEEVKEKQSLYLKEYRTKNYLKLRKYSKEYSFNRRKNDIEYKSIRNLRSQLGNFFNGKIKNNSSENLLGYSYKDFIKKMGVINKGQELDHKVPISWFKSTTPINLIWNFENLQVVSINYNRTKKNTFADSINYKYYLKIKKWLQPQQLHKVPTYL